MYLRAQVFWRILNSLHTIPTYKYLVTSKNLVSGSGRELKTGRLQQMQISLNRDRNSTDTFESSY